MHDQGNQETQDTTHITVILVDDHPVVREGLSLIIDAQPDMKVVGEASSGEEAVALASMLHPRIVLLDLKMPGMGGVAAIRKIRQGCPDSCVVVFTTYGAEEDVVAAIEAGAHGYLLKGSASNEILQAVRAAARGDAPIDPTAAKILMGRVSRPQTAGAVALSERELEVLELMAKGARNKEIAGELFITEKTVKAHVGSILSKLNVPDRTAAVTTAIKRGIIEL